MSFRMPSSQGLPRMPRVGQGPKRLGPLVVLAVALIALVGVLTSVYTDLLWFRSVGFSSIFTTRLTTQLLLFAVFGILTAILVGANIVVAYRLRPPFRPLSPEQQGLERYRVALDPYRRWALLVVVGLLGLMSGSSSASHWQTWLLWRNAVPFGQRDQQFNRDISYFTFTYPFQRFLLGYLFFVVVLSLLAAAAVHYLYGGLRLQTPGDKLTPSARAHLSVLLGIFVLLKAVAYWLDRYGLSFSTRGFVNTGASYTDINAVLPAKTILVFVALICSLLFFANLFSRGWLLPSIGLGLLVLCAVLIGGVYPAVIQRFQVKPSEADRESPYISRHIAATRQAYGLVPGAKGDTDSEDYPGTPTSAVSALRGNKATLPNVRLLDPNVLEPTFQQLQGFKSFYTFPDTLDVDRYDIGGSTQEQVVAVRELDTTGLNINQRNWINEHLVYTHGYGIVAAASNNVDSVGQPLFTQSGIDASGKPNQNTLGLNQPRIYFGEKSPAYSVVGAPGKSTPRELDFPTNSGSGQQNVTYTGTGGVDMGSTFRKAVYALHFKDKNLLLSSGVNADSRILYIREPRARVQKVAPFLTVDGDPYPAVVGGRIQWILDGYTTSDGYPYSERTQLGEVTADALTRTSTSVAAQAQSQVNYIRNSVKAVVDAYDGSVKLYQWGPRDPVLETWKKAFPRIVSPQAQIPADLLAHLRYPEDLFKVQRDLLTKFHITDPGAFYNGSDYWVIPDDPTKEGTKADQPPYYLTLALPGQTAAKFQLTTALLANNKRNLAAFISADSDPASPTYGRITVLHIPGNAPVDGPGQVQNTFKSFTAASTELSLLSQQGSSVDYGNLLTLPLGGAMLYVEPVYVKSTGATSYPLLRRVLASYNGVIAYKPTLAEALDEVFKTTASPTLPTQTGPPVTGNLNVAVKVAITEANTAYAEGQTALRKGDFTAYGAAQNRLQTALRRLSQLTKTTATPAPSPSGSPSPGATPSASPLAAPSTPPTPLVSSSP